MTAILRAATNLAATTAEALGLNSDTTVPKMRYLTRSEAAAMDDALGDCFAEDCLVDMVGLAVAASLRDAYLFHSRVLVVVGPGRTGSQGMAAARYLASFGYDVRALCPEVTNHKQSRQVDLMRIPVMKTLPDTWEATTDVVVDAVFGYADPGGRPPAPYDMVLAKLQATSIPILSVDVPSGWDCDAGPGDYGGLRPAVLVSLFAPKRCALGFEGRAHYLGGRFVPPALLASFGVKHPEFYATNHFVRLDALDDDVLDAADAAADDDDADDDGPQAEYYYF
eukprot:CAMPEP_0197416698 /NCGR_PEP_ID=MMETSP1170-20131217/2947_1 /TAXON_ID=54406 /ORGANISM="Sarcinochrysis sp, Strain CCMP770" /LENGTH=280 /DNA_ID=CAMNT_0042943613 /DNA_START=29 /DNA_END=871 /DNA_ORIENTATION=+